jgi:hypothetical protein
VSDQNLTFTQRAFKKRERVAPAILAIPAEFPQNQDLFRIDAQVHDSCLRQLASGCADAERQANRCTKLRLVAPLDPWIALILKGIIKR